MPDVGSLATGHQRPGEVAAAHRLADRDLRQWGHRPGRRTGQVFEADVEAADVEAPGERRPEDWAPGGGLRPPEPRDVSEQ